MATKTGAFVWYELMTSDPASAASFYGAVVGWKAADAGLPGPPYTFLSSGETRVGGILAIPEHAAGVRPAWWGYVAVDDVDRSAIRVRDLGGIVHRGPADIPEVGRFAVIADPQGAMLTLFKGASTPAVEMPPPNTPGLIGWRELHTSDREAGFAFYESLLGWRKAEAIDMGPVGVYQMFSTGETTIGGMWRDATASSSHWVYYMNVEAIEAAADRVRQAGGQVAQGPMKVPGGSWVLQGTDPQGAKFALVQPAG